MSRIKNEIRAKAISNNIGTNIHQNKIHENPIEKEERKEQDLSKSNANNKEKQNINSKARQELKKKKKERGYVGKEYLE